MSVSRNRVEEGGLILFLGTITVALILVVSGFIGALLWAGLAALLFQPLFQRLLARWPDRRNRAALITILIIVVAVVIPALIIAGLVVDQGASVYNQVRSGQINFATYFQQIHDALPFRLRNLLDSSGLDSLERVQARLGKALSGSASVLAQRAFSIGANAAAFLLAFGVGLYVTFFLLRDGEEIGPVLVRALPLEPSIAERLSAKFVSRWCERRSRALGSSRSSRARSAPLPSGLLDCPLHCSGVC